MCPSPIWFINRLIMNIKLLITLTIVFSLSSDKLFSQDTFLSNLNSNNIEKKQTLMVFYRPDCPYCLDMEKMINEDMVFQNNIKLNYNITVVNLTTEKGKKIGGLYNVTSVPTIILYDEISMVNKRQNGFGSTSTVLNFLNDSSQTNYSNKIHKNSTNLLGVCGDGIVDAAAGEQCDDGGVQTPSCELDCTLSRCGDSIINTLAGEQCDDGNLDDTDECLNTCQSNPLFAVCGDGIVNAVAGEQCDDGGSQTAACELNCTVPTCGDSIINLYAGEQCDDGNLDNTDTCDNFCQSIPLSVDEFETKQFTILSNYPNPFTDHINVSLFLVHVSSIKLYLYALDGKLVKTYTYKSLSFGEQNIFLEGLNKISSGSYFLKIIIDNENGSFIDSKNIIKN